MPPKANRLLSPLKKVVAMPFPIKGSALSIVKFPMLVTKMKKILNKTAGIKNKLARAMGRKLSLLVITMAINNKSIITLTGVRGKKIILSVSEKLLKTTLTVKSK